MQFINILLFTIKRLFADTKNNLVKIGMPILLMSILGSALSSAFETTNYEEVTVGYVIEDNGESARKIIENLEGSEEISRMIDFREISSVEEGQKMARRDEISAILVFHEEFSDRMNTNEGAAIEVISSEYVGTSMIIVKNVLESYTGVINAVNSMVSKGYYEAAAGYSYEKSMGLLEKPLNNDSPIAHAIDYFAVTMLVFVLLYGAQYGCETVGDDFMGNIGKRLFCSPINMASYFSGKVLGVCIVNFIQGIVLMLVATYGYHVSWGKNVPLVLLIAFCFSILVTAIGAFLSMLLKDAHKAGAILTLLIPAMTFISGGFTKFDSGFVKYLSPSYYVQNGLFSVIYDGAQENIVIAFAVMLGMSAVIGIATIVLGRRMSK